MLQHLFLFFLYSCQPEVYGAGARRVRDDGQHGCAEMPGERAGGQEQGAASDESERPQNALSTQIKFNSN